MSTPPDDPTPAAAGTRDWLRPVALVLSCLVIGFVVGWILRGDEGDVTVLPPVASADGPTATTPETPAATAGITVTAPEEPPPPPDRADISLVVLNATDQTGLAAQIAGEAEALGYEGVTASNAPSSSDPTTAYFRPDQRPAAARVARDLSIGRIQPLPAAGALADASPDGTDVTVVLGPG